MNRSRPKSFYFRTRRGEQLDPRNMLAGHPLAAVFSAAAFGFHPAFRDGGASIASTSAATTIRIHRHR
ncbi:MAG TPA: hypothetical protein VGY55_17520 [Pirellulales bacterium]|jgi:hypothetical protein|nr:hypothetical protein [Pirellulales bacterium]